MSDREFLISVGICPMCTKNKLFGGEKSCPECRAKMAEYMAVKRENPEYLKEFYGYMKQLRKERASKDRCTHCGKEKPADRYVQCEKCRIKRRLYQQGFRKRVG